MASLPVAGYAVVSWRDDLRDLDTNFKGLVGDLAQVVEWQDRHSQLHQSFNAQYSIERAKEGVIQYQVGECQRDLAKIDEIVRNLNSSLNELQDNVILMKIYYKSFLRLEDNDWFGYPRSLIASRPSRL